jgi:alkanesulfonate monooxygenase SsuD/methylene tetrahydromethanopterin reductase-like flavin-dependent oxidoreductase (luciferase family)
MANSSGRAGDVCVGAAKLGSSPHTSTLVRGIAMKIGIGLPNHCAGAPGALLVPWARRAEARGFESVITIDRLVYPSLDSLTALALAAGATTDLTLVTNILPAPLYPAALLAKQLGTLADATGSRLAIGVGVGAPR